MGPAMAEGPLRTCVGCRTRRPQDQLLRLHLDAEGRLRIDRTGPGRGAWLCAADPGPCLAAAIRRRALERAFRRRPDEASVEAVGAQLRGRRPGPGPFLTGTARL